MNLTETEKRILKLVKKEVRTTPKLIAKKLNLSEQHVRNIMANLCRFGFLNRITRGLYEVAASKIEEIKFLGEKVKEIRSRYSKKG